MTKSTEGCGILWGPRVVMGVCAVVWGLGGLGGVVLGMGAREPNICTSKSSPLSPPPKTLSHPRTPPQMSRPTTHPSCTLVSDQPWSEAQCDHAIALIISDIVILGQSFGHTLFSKQLSSTFHASRLDLPLVRAEALTLARRERR